MDCILQEHNLLLRRQYHSASSDLSLILTASHGELLPQLALKLKLPDQDIAWLSEWLSDIGKRSYLHARSHNCTAHRP